jgi:ribosomal protein S18 acetylase RimI-like enzyme
MQLRVARHTQRLDEVVAFYRDGLGFVEIGGFRDHDGYDGVFLAIPGTRAHLELTAGGGHGAPRPHPESLLVLYLGDHAAVEVIAARLDARPVDPANPYWLTHGLTFEDPDGFRVVLVPAPWPDSEVRIDWHDGPRAELRRLFELAEDSRERIDASIEQGRLLVAMDGDTVVGYLQLVRTDTPHRAELKSMAVVEQRQREGIGRALVTRAIDECRAEGMYTLLVGTAAADVGNLRFYQRLGFRMLEVERNAFTAHDGYPDGIVIDGIPLHDRVWLTLDVS